jgi:hypothetical protein
MCEICDDEGCINCDPNPDNVDFDKIEEEPEHTTLPIFPAMECLNCSRGNN